MDKYKEMLEEKGIRATHQRLSVLKYLDENRKHPTVEEIYSDLKEEHPSLSKTTVYNSVELFQNNDIIYSITIPGLKTRYDYNNENHHHFYCKECKDIIDIDVECSFMESFLEGGHRVDEVHGYFIGICEECLEENKGEKYDEKKRDI